MSKLFPIALLVLTGFSHANVVIGEACVLSEGNKMIDKTKAKAIAKGSLSQELGATIIAKTKMETQIVEVAGSSETQDTITETITLESHHFLSRVETIDEGYEVIDSQKHYCIRLQQGN